MPKAIKKRVTKKAPLREEDVRGRALNTLSFMKGKKTVLICALSALVFVIVIIIASIFYSVSTKREAYSLEIKAYDYYYNVNLPSTLPDEQRWRKALELFQRSIEVKLTPLAQFYSGNCYFNLGDYENAIKEYNKFLDKYSGEDKIVPLVYQKLASAYFKKGDSGDAVRTLETLARFNEGIFRDTALILEARHYETTGRDEDAIRRYNEIIEAFPSSLWAAEAQAKIKLNEDKKSSEEPAVPEMSLPEESTKDTD
jgi:tetratricopeptide (TPR) repeat protein